MSQSMMLCPSCWGSKTVVMPALGKSCSVCAGEGSLPDVQLSPHFWLSEFLKSQTAVRKNIPNNPPKAYLDRMKRVAVELLEPIRTQFGAISVNSGYRSEALNRALSGSSKTSAHMAAWAADLDPMVMGVKNKAVVDWVIASDLKYDQVIYEGTWVHIGLISPVGAQRRQNLMMFPDEKGIVRYYPYDSKDKRLVL